MSTSMSSVLSRIKNYLDFTSESRKRKSDDTEPIQQPNFSKYRRVSDDFPKYISAPLNNDKNRFSYFSKNKLKLNHKPQIVMDNSRRNHVKSNMENKPAFFGANAKRIECTDVEFSDDEDDIVWVNKEGTRFNSGENREVTKPVPPLKKITPQMPRLIEIDSFLSVGHGFVNGYGKPSASASTSSTGMFKRPMDVQKHTLNTLATIPAHNFYNKGVAPKQNSIVAENYNIAEKQHYRSLLQKLCPYLYNDADAASSNRSSSLPNEFNFSTSTRYNKSYPTIDLSREDDRSRRLSCSTIDLSKVDDDVIETIEIPDVDPVNTLRDKLQTSNVFRDDVVTSVNRRYRESLSLRQNQIHQEKNELKELTKTTKENESTLEKKLGDYMTKLDLDTIILDDEEEEEIDEYPILTDESRSLVKRALYGGSRTDVLINKFNISITRNDIATLVGDNWLNDEVINFYMNLLMERSEKDDSLPKVYPMNTFFIPKLLSSGHSGLKRWTRKVDIFSYDVIPIPVHVGRVHWCMSIIHLKNKTIKYYDSMGSPNDAVLNALERYLIDECYDKKKERFDTSGFKKENVRDCPRQMNGSDCGVFSCQFAEFVCRNRGITFGQQQMQYFREKMIFEIISGKLLL